MDTVKIRAILSAVRLGSLSKAAEKFSYTPSAMSHIADALEAELGVKLLSRTPGGVSLTAEGEKLLDSLSAVVEAEDKLKREACLLSSSVDKELVIGSYSSISQHLLPELLHGFKEQNPDIKVTVIVGNSLQGWLNSGRADVIFSDTDPIGEADAWVPMLSDPYVAVVPSNTAGERRSVRREELYSSASISTSETMLKEYFDESRFPGVTRFVSVDDASVISMVKEGLGVAVLPSLATGKLKRGVRALRLEPQISRTVGFAYLKDGTKKHATASFVNYLKKYVN